MPIIRPSSDLRNNYNEISTICNKTNNPVYITKYTLYKQLQRGIDSLENEPKYSAEEILDILNKI